MAENSAQIKCGVGIAAVFIIGFIILLCSSFADVHYYEVLTISWLANTLFLVRLNIRLHHEGMTDQQIVAYGRQCDLH